MQFGWFSYIFTYCKEKTHTNNVLECLSVPSAALRSF